MTTDLGARILAGVAVVFAAVALALSMSGGHSFGSTASQTSTAGYYNAGTSGTGGFRLNGTNVLTSSVLKTTSAGGTLTVTTSDTATSTSALGCIQTTATSTATPVRFVLTISTTTSATYRGGSTLGFVGYQYGNCP